MTFLQLSRIIVALAVAMVVILVYTLRNNDKAAATLGDYERFLGVRVDKASSNTGSMSHSVKVKSSWHHHGGRGGDRKQQGERSPNFTLPSRDEHKKSAHEISRTLPPSSNPGSIVWLNNDGFGPGRLQLLSPAPDSNRLIEDSQKDVSGLRDNKASVAEKWAGEIAPSSPDKQSGFNKYDSREKRLKRADRQTYLKNVDLRMLQNN